MLLCFLCVCECFVYYFCLLFICSTFFCFTAALTVGDVVVVVVIVVFDDFADVTHRIEHRTEFWVRLLLLLNCSRKRDIFYLSNVLFSFLFHFWW